MADGFDAYYQWLGIAPKDQPPNHYRLLGVDPFESNPDVIETAADRQMIHVRTFQSGPHGVASQKLLNEITAAKLCLLNVSRKAEYDDKLRAEREAAEATTRPQARVVRGAPTPSTGSSGSEETDLGPPMPRPPQGAFDLHTADSRPRPGALYLPTASTDTQPTRRRMTTAQQAAIAGGVLGVIVVLAVILLNRGGDSIAERNTKGGPKEKKTVREKPRPTVTQPTVPDPPITPPPSKPWDHLDLGTAVVIDDYVRIADSLITTKQEHSGPIEITVVARTDSTNIRLDAYRGACIIFNWEIKPDELRINRPDGNTALESGSLTTAAVKPLKLDTWCRLTWRITAEGMDVLVDDERVFSERASYDLSSSGRIGVRSYKSVVDVKDLRVVEVSKR